MKWEQRIDDPLPALILEAYGRGAMQDEHPCSLCRNVTHQFKSGVDLGPITGRRHFHASDLGACKRRVLYGMRNPKQAKSSTSAVFLKTGHMFESFMLTNMHNGFQQMIDKVKHFGKANVVRASNREETIAKIPVMIDNDIEEIVLVAHWDGILAFEYNGQPGQAFLLECKSVKQAKFDRIRGGEMDQEWYGQMQTYLRVLDLKVGYLLMVHRESSQMLLPIRVDIDYEYLNRRRDVLTEIFVALHKGGQVDREETKKSSSQCHWCKFKDECWSDKVDWKLEEKVPQVVEEELETFEETFDQIV